MASSGPPFVENHPVTAFFIGAYAYTWAVSAPAMFLPVGWPAAILMYVGSFGPPLSAATVTWLRGDDVREWARQIVRWRVGWKWWAVALGLPIAAAVVVTLLLFLVRGPVDLGQALPSPLLFVGIFLFAMVLSGGLNEEPGWRGFAQPRLNGEYGALQASLLIGVVWAGWHLPYYFIPVAPHFNFTLVNGLGWLGSILALSVLLAWVYNNTGSVLLAMALHAMVNTADLLIPLAADEILVDGVVSEQAVGIVAVVHLAVYVVIVLLVVAHYGRKRLANGAVPEATYAGD